LLLEVHVVPRASRSQVSGIHDGRLKVALAAPPVDGAANQALIAFLSSELSLPKRDVTLLRGDASRQKLVSLRGLGLDALERWLQPWLTGGTDGSDR
jgi:uncharacterized protein (TIGR00251 family)